MRWMDYLKLCATVFITWYGHVRRENDKTIVVKIRFDTRTGNLKTNHINGRDFGGNENKMVAGGSLKDRDE